MFGYTKADDLVLAILVLDQNGELLGFARCFLRLVRALENFAGVTIFLLMTYSGKQ